MAKTLCLDFDGVIHSYTSGWQGADVIPDEPVEGAMAFITDAMAAGWTVAIYSSRSHQEGGIKAMREFVLAHLQKWWETNNVSADTPRVIGAIEWPTHKPAAFMTLDDRALTFEGTWPDLDRLAGFKPWNKRDPGDQQDSKETDVPVGWSTKFIPRDGMELETRKSRLTALLKAIAAQHYDCNEPEIEIEFFDYARTVEIDMSGNGWTFHMARETNGRMESLLRQIIDGNGTVAPPTGLGLSSSTESERERVKIRGVFLELMLEVKRPVDHRTRWSSVLIRADQIVLIGDSPDESGNVEITLKGGSHVYFANHPREEILNAVGEVRERYNPLPIPIGAI